MSSNTAFDADQVAQASGHQQVVALIPRINIQAFLEDDATAQAIQIAASDRRMSKAHTEIHLGGIPAAAQAFSQSKTPPVLIVECREDRQGFMQRIGDLAQVCDPSTKVIVIGHVNDVILYRELMRAGVSEYIVAPLNPLQIVESIGGLFQNPDAKPIGKVIAFLGAKGGVGSSTIAHNVGWLLSKKFDVETVITDLDLAFGTAGLNFNHDPAQGIAEALHASDRIDQVLIDRLLTKCSDKLSLLTAPSSIDRDVDIEGDALERILNVVRGNVPYVIVDMPNVWSPWARHTLEQADDVIITVTPELACLRNAKNIIEALKGARPNDGPPKIVLNQVGVLKRPEIPAADFGKALGVEPTVVIQYDAQIFGTANSNGQMIAEVSAKSKAAESIAALTQMIAGQMPQANKKGASLLAPLMGKLPSLRKK